MSKFKIGDLVRCIGDKPGGSSGWVKDYEFIIDYIRGGDCYFPKDDNGVFERQLELVRNGDRLYRFLLRTNPHKSRL